MSGRKVTDCEQRERLVRQKLEFEWRLLTRTLRLPVPYHSITLLPRLCLCANFNLAVPQVKISTRGARRIRKGHLWVYRGDLCEIGDAGGGEIVRVVDDAGNFVGQAFYSDRSEIALRFLTTRTEAIDRDWWRMRLQQCAERRAFIARDTNAYRLVYSEGDLLSSLMVDVYDDVRVREFEGLEKVTGLVYGDAPREIEIKQHGTRFIVSPLSGQKTGAFLDQRENYLAARQVAHGRALDCFTFNGGFALHVAPACESVQGIDISADAIAAAQRNAELNKISNVEFRAANVFDELREMEAAGEHFDTIVLDPPAFAKNRATVKSAARGYKEINLRALKLLNPGGVLVTCTCSYHVNEEMFLAIVADAALDAHRRLQIIERRGQSPDHPVLMGVPETHYLKCVIARVVS